MTDFDPLLTSIILNELTNEEQLYYESCDEENRKIFMTNKRYFYDKKLRQDALKKVLSRRYERYMEQLIDNSNAEELLPTLKLIKEQEAKSDECLKSNYVFITISPKFVGVMEFIRLIEKFVKLKAIRRYCYVIEQRYSGEPDEINKKLGDGLHTHIFLDKGDYKPSHLARDLKRVFANITCNTDISYRWPKDVEKTFNYIIGDKKDESKRLKQSQDKLFRELNDLRAFYGEIFSIESDKVC